MWAMTIEYSEEPIEGFGIGRKCLQHLEAVLIGLWHEQFLNLLIWDDVFVPRRRHDLLQYHSASADSAVLQKLERLGEPMHAHKGSCPHTGNHSFIWRLCRRFLHWLHHATGLGFGLRFAFHWCYLFTQSDLQWRWTWVIESPLLLSIGL